MHIEKVCGIYVYFYLQYFSKLARYPCCCRTFLQARCKHVLPISASRCYSVVPVVRGIIYELRAKRGWYREPNGIIDTADNRRFITRRNGYEMTSTLKKKVIRYEWFGVRGVICQECLDIRPLSARARAWISLYLTLIAIEFRRALNLINFLTKYRISAKFFVNGSDVSLCTRARERISPKRANVFRGACYFFLFHSFIFLVLQEFRKNSMLTTILREGKEY